MTFKQARTAARQFFPNWSRRMRARWVIAKLKVDQPRVGISSGWKYDHNAYAFARRA